MKAVFWTLVGLFAGLWLTERRHSEAIKRIYERQLATPPVQPQSAVQAAPEPRPSRTPQEISPLFKEHEEQKRRLYHLNMDKIANYIHRLTGELIQPNMTELEAKLVHDELSWLMRDVTMYESEHEEYMKKQQDKWLDEATEVTDE